MAEENHGKHGIFPECPECHEGALVPFSFKEDVYEKWKCTKCGFEVKKREDR
jgi:uncharacterized protein (DUF983 family)